MLRSPRFPTTSTPTPSTTHPSAPFLSSFPFISCIVLLYFLSSFLSAVRADLNGALQAGWSPNSSEVISDGYFNPSSLSTSFPSWQPFPTLYLWLSGPVITPVPYRAVAPNQPTNTQYTPVITPAKWLAAKNNEYVDVYNVNDPQLEEQAVLVSSGGFCAVQRSTPGVSAKIVLNTAADYDDVLISFTHDCVYPRVNIGRPPATDDVIQYSMSVDPQLEPNAGVQLSVLANTGAVLQLDVRVVDIGEKQWQHGQNASFTIDVLEASNNVLLSTTLVTPEVDTIQNVTISQQLLADPAAYTRITVASTCTDPANTGSITLSLSFDFARSITLPINITCQPQKSVDPLLSFGVDLLPSPQFVSSPTPIVVNGTVPSSSAFNVQPPAGQPYTFLLPQRYVSLRLYNVNSLNITGRLTVSAGNSLVALTASEVTTTTGDPILFKLRSNRLTVQIETQCQYSQQLQTTIVVIDQITDGVVHDYDPVEFKYQWMCQQPPQFALSTQSPNALSAGNLIDMGQPIGSAGGDWQVDANASAGVINVNYNIRAELESVVSAPLYLTLQSSNATTFAWSLDSSSSLGLSNVTFYMQGQKLQSGSAYKSNVPLSAGSGTATKQLLLDRLLCSTREYVQLTTRLTYGWSSYVTINYNRRCEQADQLEYSSALSGGAVAAIVLLVLLTACCVMGCGWRYSSKGKRGWEVMPFYDVWSQVQDSALGPKRYTGPQMAEDDLEDMTDEAIEISSTGGYGSTSYQNDL